MKKGKIYISNYNTDHITSSGINIGIQILRMILSYLVLQLHCYNIHHTKNKIILASFRVHKFCVPTFYVISYYFSFTTLKLKNINKINLRLKRIIIPYIIWPTFIFIINNNFSILKKIKLKNLFIQLLTGKRIYYIFWFHCNLIFSFIFLSIIALLLRNNYVFNIQLIGIVGYIYHYLHYYYYFFENYIYEIRSLIQDFFQVLFFASLGISISFIGGINYFKINRKKSIFFSLIILYLIRDYLILIKEFYYLKSIILGIGAVSLFILFSMLLLDNNNKNFPNKIIIQITNYTGGVYYLHNKIREILSHILIVVKNKTLFGCIINYITCYIICFIGFKIFKKTNLKYLFI